MGKSIVIAFGGNAITKENQKGTFQEQVVNIKEMCSNLVDLIKNGYHLVLTDLAGQQLARDVGAETFVILTGVSHVAINYGKESQKELDTITVSEGRRYQQEGHFPPGSMGPKMEAALLFVENGGHKSIITSPE